MNNIRRIIVKICYGEKSPITARRRRYHKVQRKKLENFDFSILANDCIGTFIYHDLGLRFLSPTINLYFDTYEDYLEYLENLEYYASAELFQIESDKDFPVGRLVRGDRSITVNFMHYNTFEQAKEKWTERGKRLDYDNLMVLFNCPEQDKCSDALISRFFELPFNNKYLVTGNRVCCDNKPVVRFKVFDKNYYSGKLFKYKSPVSSKRHLGDWDYVRVINRMDNTRRTK